MHQPVLLHEVVQYLSVKPGGVYIDCTVGEGGHALSILHAAMPGGRLLGIDLDHQALECARQRLQDYKNSVTLAKGSYAKLEDLVPTMGIPKPDGILMDLGMSSFQLESHDRGFSLRREEPLDMRYDAESLPSAAEIVNGYPLNDLADVIFRYGEESRARSIATAIIRSRPVRTTIELADLVAQVKGGRRGKIHPATRVFQALRIEVNSELDNLKVGLQQAVNLLKPGGVLVVISYHSLEDRIVKETMAREAKGCICPPRVPICTCGHTALLRIISRKVMTPSKEEVQRNPRSRSARMRVAQRL